MQPVSASALALASLLVCPLTSSAAHAQAPSVGARTRLLPTRTQHIRELATHGTTATSAARASSAAASAPSSSSVTGSMSATASITATAANPDDERASTAAASSAAQIEQATQAALAAALAGAATSQTYCAPALRDQALVHGCLQASSDPTLGMLYPLGADFNVAANGNVGIGKLNPASTLDVAGDVRASKRFALGNSAIFGMNDYYDAVFDLSSHVTDMSSSHYWTPMRSYFTLAPSVGETVTAVYGHDLWTWITADSTQNMGHVQGAYLAAFNDGTGSLASLSGGSFVAETEAGYVAQQLGAYIASVAKGSGTLADNRWLALQGGHWGGSGSIANDYGLYVQQPDTSGAVQNHYGIFLESQTGASGANYALYSEGGDVYLAGHVGIGAQPSSYALQVGSPGDGSEARANAWNVLSSREYKRDIEKLDAREYADVLRKIDATDVVHYRYTNDEHVHLGVIAEESPKEILSRDGKGVSLGDYAGFLLAGLKAQQSELDTLRAELAELRARLDARDAAR